MCFYVLIHFITIECSDITNLLPRAKKILINVFLGSLSLGTFFIRIRWFVQNQHQLLKKLNNQYALFQKERNVLTLDVCW